MRYRLDSSPGGIYGRVDSDKGEGVTGSYEVSMCCNRFGFVVYCVRSSLTNKTGKHMNALARKKTGLSPRPETIVSVPQFPGVVEG